MIVTAHQPAYLPWLGYLAKIAASDVYVFMDDVQFENRSFINRNKIKISNGKGSWLTVPVKGKGHRDGTMMTLAVDNESNWKKQHLDAMYYNYKKAPQFDVLYSKIETLYKEEHDLLVDLCLEQYYFWADILNITTKVVRLSELKLESDKASLIVDACTVLKATTYISGALGQDYLTQHDFKGTDTKLVFQDYEHPEYPQLWGKFLPCMSILDFCMNTDNDRLIYEGNKLHE